jgi:hypothetical protein
VRPAFDECVAPENFRDAASTRVLQRERTTRSGLNVAPLI